MIEDSETKCDECFMEYYRSEDETKCISRVLHCDTMIESSTTEC